MFVCGGIGGGGGAFHFTILQAEGLCFCRAHGPYNSSMARLQYPRPLHEGRRRGAYKENHVKFPAEKQRFCRHKRDEYILLFHRLGASLLQMQCVCVCVFVEGEHSICHVASRKTLYFSAAHEQYNSSMARLQYPRPLDQGRRRGAYEENQVKL